MPSAYLIADADITDPEQYAEYRAQLKHYELRAIAGRGVKFDVKFAHFISHVSHVFSQTQHLQGL